MTEEAEPDDEEVDGTTELEVTDVIPFSDDCAWQIETQIKRTHTNTIVLETGMENAVSCMSRERSGCEGRVFQRTDGSQAVKRTSYATTSVAS